MVRQNFLTRFNSKVQFGEGCWEWRGCKDENGYGEFRITDMKKGIRKIVKAHRVSWELQNGGILEGKQVLHRCDNPSCVRPDHLFLGTHADNMRDMVAKGRASRKAKVAGDNHPFAKLTQDLVDKARVEYACGKRIIDISRDNQVSYRSIWNAIKGVSWK